MLKMFSLLFLFNIVCAQTLSYYGGPIVQSVNVVTVWWGGKSNVQYADNLNGFYTGVTKSPWFDVMSEYNTNGYTIGSGTWVGEYSDTAAPNGTVTDAQIQSRLLQLINSNSVPYNENTYYAIHFMPGVYISDYGGSCVYFCAYHGTIQYGSSYVYYGVMPDQGGNCLGGCGSDPSLFNNICSVSSHELAEMVTDPAVGLATIDAYPLAWYSGSLGEIGDICGGTEVLDS